MQQDRLIAGDTLSFSTSAPAYPASDGWVMRYRLMPRSGSGPAIDISSVAHGDDHLVQVGPAVTSGWAAGEYGWASWVDRSGERYTVCSGTLTILADPRQAGAGFDPRTAARRALDDARAALAAWSPTMRRYRIGTREMEFASADDILKVISYWEGVVHDEQGAAGNGRVRRFIRTRI